MKNKLLHTPEGVRDIYNAECKKKLYLQERLHKKFRQYGFQDIQTPTFEYFDVFSQEVGTIPSKDLYKFFDREGNTLVLRPDYTPSIARCAATYYMEEDMPLRFCYAGNVFINESGLYQGRLKETTQLGAEMIGDTAVDADTEMVSLVIQLLLESGLKNFQVEIGQIDFFKGLLEEADINEETAETLRHLIAQKNYFGLEELLSSQSIDGELKSVFLKLPQLFGSAEILQEARSLTKNSRSLQAIDRLQQIYDRIKIYHLEQYVTFDLGMLSNYNYYTGIIFRAFTLGTGEPIVKGGRYDNLLGLFGKSAPSIGFTLLLDLLILALSRQKIEVPTGNKNIMYLYKKEQHKVAMQMAMESRNRGNFIELVRLDENKSLNDYCIYGKRNHIAEIYFFEKESVVLSIKPDTGESIEIAINELQ